jgi:hypothetical protein
VAEPDAGAMQRAAMAAMVDALGDPYSTYLGPDEERWLRTQVSGSYVGIGVELDVRDGFPLVVTAIDDSPALEAGILPGDQLVEVDGRSTEGIAFAELESTLGELERARTIFGLAVQQSALDMPETLWKAYIDFEIEQGDLERARSLYRQLLDRTSHPKVSAC